VSVALVIQHVKHMRRIVVSGVPGSTIFCHLISKMERYSEKITEHKICVFSLRILSEIFLFLGRVQRDLIKDVYLSSWKAPVILVRF